MDDLLKGLVAMPDLIARPRHILPDPGQEAAFMAAFTRLDGVPAIPLGDQAGAPLDMGVVMPPLLPGKLSLEHRAMPPPSDVLPDAFDTASPLMSSGPITVPPAQDLAAPADDMAPAALARSLFPDPDLAMRAPEVVARIETAPPAGNGADRQAVEKALIGPAVTKAKPAFHPAAPVPMAGFPSVGMTLTPAPTAMVKGEAPMPVPFPVDAPKAAGLAVVDIGNPPATQPKLPTTPIGPLPAIMMDQGDTALPNLPVRPPTQDNLIQVSSGPPMLPEHAPLPKDARAARLATEPMPPPLPRSVEMAAPLQTVAAKVSDDGIAPAATEFTADRARPAPAQLLHMAPSMPPSSPMSQRDAPKPDAPVVMTLPPAPASRVVADPAPMLPQTMTPTTRPDVQVPAPTQPKSIAIATIPSTSSTLAPQMPASAASVVQILPADPLPKTLAADIPLLVPQAIPADRIIVVPGREMSAIGDPGDVSLNLANGTAPSLVARPSGTGMPDLPVLAQSASQQIVNASAQLQAEPGGPIDIALDPPELGRVRLSLVEVNGAMTVSITAERPETADLMRRHLALLADEFARQGLDAPMVDISGGDQGGRQPRDDDQSGADNGQDRAIGHPIVSTANAAPRVAAAGLDLRL